MFKFQSFQLKVAPVLSALLLTAVAVTHSETGSALLAAFQIVLNGQPQGF